MMTSLMDRLCIALAQRIPVLIKHGFVHVFLHAKSRKLTFRNKWQTHGAAQEFSHVAFKCAWFLVFLLLLKCSALLVSFIQLAMCT